MQIHRTGPETERLTHRAFDVTDAAAFFAINSDPEVIRFTGDILVESLEQARSMIASYPDFDSVGYGRWACIHKSTGDIIGSCGLKYLPEFDEVDVGYRFLPKYWGQGFATEACEASLSFGFEVLGLQRIIGLALPENGASIRVMQKVGMQSDGQMQYDEDRVVRFVITQAQHQGRPEGPSPI